MTFDDCRMGCSKVINKPKRWDSFTNTERRQWLKAKEMAQPALCSLCIIRGGWDTCWFSRHDYEHYAEELECQKVKK